MKTSIYTTTMVILLCATTYLANAQSTGSVNKYWSLTGNSGTSTTKDFLGTTDAKGVIFRTDDTERMRIVAGGNIGIGTKAPAYKLDVVGDINQSNGSIIRVGGARVIKYDSIYYNLWIGGGGFSDDVSVNGYGNYNTANGSLSLYSNTTGYESTANGSYSLYANTTGYENTAYGDFSLMRNTTGNNNTAAGEYALFTTTASNNNTAIGFQAGFVYNNGYNNVFLGANTDVNGNGYYNDIVIGQGTTGTTSNQVTMGNSSTNSYRAYANWSNISDSRVKQNIKQNVPGLAFINKLQPITYNLNLDAIDKIIQPPVQKDEKGNVMQPTQQELSSRKAKEQITYTGFIAQDVEVAAKSLNYDFSGVDAAKNSKDLYGLRYAEFVVPLVKAVQELSNANDAKDATINTQQQQINDLEARLSKLEALMNVQPTSVAISSASIEQNIPNPFKGTTTISYTLPQTYNSAQIIIRDNSGHTLKAMNVSGNGKGTLNVDASTLSSGAYSYSLLVDGKLISTKQMVLAK